MVGWDGLPTPSCPATKALPCRDSTTLLGQFSSPSHYIYIHIGIYIIFVYIYIYIYIIISYLGEKTKPISKKYFNMMSSTVVLQLLFYLQKLRSLFFTMLKSII